MDWDWRDDIAVWQQQLAGARALGADVRTIQDFDGQPVIVVISTAVGVGFDTTFEEWWANKVREQTAANYQDYLSSSNQPPDEATDYDESEAGPVDQLPSSPDG